MSGASNCGLCQGEQQIVDRADRGMAAEAIAKELGLSLSYVRATIANLSFASCWAEGDNFNINTRSSTQALLAAIRRTGKVFS